MNILSGYHTKNVRGSIQLNGQELKKYRRSIAYILQDSFLEPLLTVRESLDFAIKLKTSANPSMRVKKVNNILTSFGLEDKTNELVKNLSGGQLKRLAIALEIVDDPLVIYIDEVTSGLGSYFKITRNLNAESRPQTSRVFFPPRWSTDVLDF